MSPRNKQQWSKFRVDKKAHIMDVALRLFALGGFHSTTIDQIASSAGISKGLIYTYFKSKEDLLNQIIDKAINAIYSNFDSNRDGYLTEEEFSIFITTVAEDLSRNKTAWRLFFQVIMQRDVMTLFEQNYSNPEYEMSSTGSRALSFISGIQKTVQEYFNRKVLRKPPGFDPVAEMELFIYTFKGFILTVVFNDKHDEQAFRKSVNLLIQTFR
jgi:AcrR family transcriptional regulator